MVAPAMEIDADGSVRSSNASTVGRKPGLRLGGQRPARLMVELARYDDRSQFRGFMTSIPLVETRSAIE
jgi:hypothetical protein